MGFNFAKTCFQAASGVCGSLKRGLRLGSIGFSGCLLFFAWGLGQQLAENGVDAEGDAYPVGELLVAVRGGGFQMEHAVHDAVFAADGQAGLAGAAPVVRAGEFAVGKPLLGAGGDLRPA